jgi:pimeloyl-ACP methyl ester carboxylesterase
MHFIHFLSSHMLDPTVGGKRLYKSVVEQALHAEKLGYRGVAKHRDGTLAQRDYGTTMVLTGELDGGCNPRLNAQVAKAKAMPNAQLVILEGLKHAIFIEGTDRVLPHVRRFLLSQELK